MLARAGVGIRRLAFVRIELLLDDSLSSCLLTSRLMLRLELCVARLADSDDRNVLDPLDNPKTALEHEYSLPQFAKLTTHANRKPPDLPARGDPRQEPIRRWAGVVG